MSPKHPRIRGARFPLKVYCLIGVAQKKVTVAQPEISKKDILPTWIELEHFLKVGKGRLWLA